MDEGKIVLGATVVVVAEETGRHMTFRLVDEDASNISAGLLSAQSPLGSALIGSRIGDQVEVEAPAGIQKYTILKMRNR